MRRIILLFILLAGCLPEAEAQRLTSDLNQWYQIKGEHFVVYAANREREAIVRDVLRSAEEYYDKIARQIGYARYGNFWTWDERVKIIIFPDQLSFSVTTNQPVWSKGYAMRDSKLFESRVIVTFEQEENFLAGVLPHEIGHLILKDYVGFNRPIPLWFDEGVAQLQEKTDERAQRVLAYLAQKGDHIPFELLNRIDIRQETDGQKVGIFYAQSRLILEFLIKQYGQGAFQRLCHDLKDGRPFEEALKNAYSPSIDSMKTLEQKWVSYMSAGRPGEN